MGKIEIYCDGSCKNNGSPQATGGIGVVLNYIIDGEIKKTKNISEKIPTIGITNNYAEIYACIRGLQAVIDKSIPVTVYSDSQYVINTINLNWKRNYNHTLWQMLDREIDSIDTIEFKHIKGHSGNKFNELADKLAGESYGK